MATSKYTDQQKARALKLYGERGPSVAAKETGIPGPTIRKWAQRAGVTGPRAKRVQAATEAARAEFAMRREDLRVRMLATIEDLFDRIQEPHQDFKGGEGIEVVYDKAPSGSVRDYTWSIGVLVDKLRLELGEHTASQRLEGSQVDREIVRLLDEMDRRDVVNGNGNGHRAPA